MIVVKINVLQCRLTARPDDLSWVELNCTSSLGPILHDASGTLILLADAGNSVFRPSEPPDFIKQCNFS